MPELIAQLIPYILVGAGALAGIGGTVKYYRGNNNGKWNGQAERRIEPTITLRECDLRHKGIEKELKEGNRRMSGVEKQVRELNNHIIQHFAG